MFKTGDTVRVKHKNVTSFDGFVVKPVEINSDDEYIVIGRFWGVLHPDGFYNTEHLYRKKLLLLEKRWSLNLEIPYDGRR